jgi:hypothetical protein
VKDDAMISSRASNAWAEAWRLLRGLSLGANCSAQLEQLDNCAPAPRGDADDHRERLS